MSSGVDGSASRAPRHCSGVLGWLIGAHITGRSAMLITVLLRERSPSLRHQGAVSMDTDTLLSLLASLLDEKPEDTAVLLEVLVECDGDVQRAARILNARDEPREKKAGKQSRELVAATRVKVVQRQCVGFPSKARPPTTQDGSSPTNASDTVSGCPTHDLHSPSIGPPSRARM
jgi:hypothetical protein